MIINCKFKEDGREVALKVRQDQLKLFEQKMAEYEAGGDLDLTPFTVLHVIKPEERKNVTGI